MSWWKVKEKEECLLCPSKDGLKGVVISEKILSLSFFTARNPFFAPPVGGLFCYVATKPARALFWVSSPSPFAALFLPIFSLHSDFLNFFYDEETLFASRFRFTLLYFLFRTVLFYALGFWALRTTLRSSAARSGLASCGRSWRLRPSARRRRARWASRGWSPTALTRQHSLCMT